MKIVVIGGVESTNILINKLGEHNFKNVNVWGFVPINTENVSGWTNLEPISSKYGYKHNPFINLSDCEKSISEYSPDIIFAVGLSQLISEKLINGTKYGCIGFHPTALPAGRGRAAIAWLILQQEKGAATFFKIRKGIDDGPILAQEVFDITALDDANTAYQKVLDAESKALDNLLPLIISSDGEIIGIEQNHKLASWYGKRTPDDGSINWQRSAQQIDTLVKASTNPHPGAFTFSKLDKIVIWDSEVVEKPIIGVVGRILEISSNNEFIVQTGSGLLKVIKWSASNSTNWKPTIGKKLGYYDEIEINNILIKNIELEKRIDELEQLVNTISKEQK